MEKPREFQGLQGFCMHAALASGGRGVIHPNAGARFPGRPCRSFAGKLSHGGFHHFAQILGGTGPHLGDDADDLRLNFRGVKLGGQKREEDTKFLLFFVGQILSACFGKLEDGVPPLLGLAVNYRHQFRLA